MVGELVILRGGKRKGKTRCLSTAFLFLFGRLVNAVFSRRLRVNGTPSHAMLCYPIALLAPLLVCFASSRLRHIKEKISDGEIKEGELAHAKNARTKTEAEGNLYVCFVTRLASILSLAAVATSSATKANPSTFLLYSPSFSTIFPPSITRYSSPTNMRISASTIKFS